MTVALEFRNVDILFCKGHGRRRDENLAAALQLLDTGADRAEIAQQTGVVLGVTNASLVVEQGKISVLMGLSGSGKSTLLRAANGLNKVTRGHVLVRDGLGSRDIAACDEATLRHIRRNRVAMVFQHFALLPWRTVRENVAFGLELRGTPRAEIAEIVDARLALVGLDKWADRVDERQAAFARGADEGLLPFGARCGQPCVGPGAVTSICCPQSAQRMNRPVNAGLINAVRPQAQRNDSHPAFCRV